MPKILQYTRLGVFGLALAGCARSDTSRGQQTFGTPDEAVTAIIAAARANNTAALDSMLGGGGEGIVTSSDTVADRAERARFVERYDEHHALVESGKDTLILNVGATDWPAPMPLVKANGKWHWDGAAGRDEVFYRRIGHNELKAIAVCRGVVDAQQDYAAAPHDGHPAGAYAQRLMSDDGKQDGLYWPVKQGEPSSPLGPGIADAGSEGYDTSGVRTPYHGYYYRLMPSAPNAFGLVAYPADYRQSGVMTFMVNQSGVVYQKDLGQYTASEAQALKGYAVDSTWTVVPEDQ
jgi:hypothetical protein